MRALLIGALLAVPAAAAPVAPPPPPGLLPGVRVEAAAGHALRDGSRLHEGARLARPGGGTLAAAVLHLSDDLALATARETLRRGCGGAAASRPSRTRLRGAVFEADADARLAGAAPERLAVDRLEIATDGGACAWTMRGEILRIASPGGALRLEAMFVGERRDVGGGRRIDLDLQGVDLRDAAGAPLMSAARLQLRLEADAAALAALRAPDPTVALPAAAQRGARIHVSLSIEDLAADMARLLPREALARRAALPPPVSGRARLHLSLAEGALSIDGASDLSGLLRAALGLEARFGAAALPAMLARRVPFPPEIAGMTLDGAEFAWRDEGLAALLEAMLGLRPETLPPRFGEAVARRLEGRLPAASAGVPIEAAAVVAEVMRRGGRIEIAPASPLALLRLGLELVARPSGLADIAGVRVSLDADE